MPRTSQEWCLKLQNLKRWRRSERRNIFPTRKSQGTVRGCLRLHTTNVELVGSLKLCKLDQVQGWISDQSSGEKLYQGTNSMSEARVVDRWVSHVCRIRHRKTTKKEAPGELGSPEVGNAVGDAVGCAVIDVVGDAVGDAVGDTVGDGSEVGDAVGDAVGVAVGDAVRDAWKVDGEVGDAIGDAVGCTVGAAVGGGTSVSEHVQT